MRDLCIYKKVFEDGPSNATKCIFPRLTPVAMATKFGTKLAITRLASEIFVPVGGFSGMGHQMPPIAFFPTNPCCHGNEIWDKIGYNSVCVRDFGEIFVPIGGFSGMGHQMLLTEFYPD